MGDFWCAWPRFYISTRKLAFGMDKVCSYRWRKHLVTQVDFCERGICPLEFYLLTMQQAVRATWREESAEDQK